MSGSGAQSSGTYDKEGLLARLRSSEERFLKSVAGVPEKLSTIRPHPDAWSIREVAEHVALVEPVVVASLKRAKAKETEPDLELDARILNAVMDRSLKLEAPEAFRPSGGFRSLSEAVAVFKRERKGTSLRHPIGPMDGYQYLLIMAAHPERHALQIDEIKNDPAYIKAEK